MSPSLTSHNSPQHQRHTPPPLRRDAFLSGYCSCYHERSYWIDDSMVEGAIPPELEGTLLRNGPGLFEVGGKKVRDCEVTCVSYEVQPAAGAAPATTSAAAKLSTVCLPVVPPRASAIPLPFD